jgi:hypothetical protein
MRRFAVIPAVLVCVATVFVSASYAAPDWTRAAGLDFWNLGNEQANLRTAAERERDLDALTDTARRRGEVLDGLAADLCDGRATLAESVEAVLALAQTDPEWFAGVGDEYRQRGFVGLTATDRDVAAQYLFVRIEGMRWTAEQLGDVSRAAAVSARVAQLADELRSVAAAPSAAH